MSGPEVLLRLIVAALVTALAEGIDRGWLGNVLPLWVCALIGLALAFGGWLVVVWIDE